MNHVITQFISGNQTPEGVMALKYNGRVGKICLYFLSILFRPVYDNGGCKQFTR